MNWQKRIDDLQREQQVGPLVLRLNHTKDCPGLWFWRPDGVRCVHPPTMPPTLYAFPQPYHPVEVLMSSRGWGGKVGSDGWREIDRFRRGTAVQAALTAADVLYTPAHEVLYLMHLLTPWGTPWNVDLSMRLMLWRVAVYYCLRFDSSEHPSTMTDYPNFWKDYDELRRRYEDGTGETSPKQLLPTCGAGDDGVDPPGGAPRS